MVGLSLFRFFRFSGSLGSCSFHFDRSDRSDRQMAHRTAGCFLVQTCWLVSWFQRFSRKEAAKARGPYTSLPSKPPGPRFLPGTTRSSEKAVVPFPRRHNASTSQQGRLPCHHWGPAHFGCRHAHDFHPFARRGYRRVTVDETEVSQRAPSGAALRRTDSGCTQTWGAVRRKRRVVLNITSPFWSKGE